MTEGRKDGRTEGRKEGRKDGRTEGRTEGRTVNVVGGIQVLGGLLWYFDRKREEGKESEGRQKRRRKKEEQKGRTVSEIEGKKSVQQKAKETEEH